MVVKRPSKMQLASQPQQQWFWRRTNDQSHTPVHAKEEMKDDDDTVTKAPDIFYTFIKRVEHLQLRAQELLIEHP